MPSSGPRARCCGLCGAARVFIGDESDVRVRVCFICDAPQLGSTGGVQPFDPPTWEINQRRRERGELA